VSLLPKERRQNNAQRFKKARKTMKSSAGLLKVRLAPKDKDSKDEFLMALAWSRGSEKSGISMLHAIAEVRKYAPHHQYSYYTLIAYDRINKAA
jgi:protein subunit release factor A